MGGLMAGCPCGGYIYDGFCTECGRDIGDGLDYESEARRERVQMESDAAAKEARDGLKAERELAARDRATFGGFDDYW